MSHIPKVRKIRSKDELDAVLAAAKKDSDGIVLPSHLVEKDGEIVGAASLAVVPVLMVWNSRGKIGPKESLILKQTYEALMEERGIQKYIVLCNKNSPYNPVMKSLGYRSVWETEIFENEVNQHVLS